MLSTATRHSITEVLGLVQKTVLNAATEVEEEALARVAALNSELQILRVELNTSRAELQDAKLERDDVRKNLHESELQMTGYERELVQMRATACLTTIDNLRREVNHWKEQAKNWQDHYTRVEQDRCGLSTELLTLSRSAFSESPSKPHNASEYIKGSSSSTRPPAYKSVLPPSPLNTALLAESASVRRNPLTKPPSASRPDHADGALSFQKPSKGAAAKQAQTSAQPPRQIFVRRVQAVIQVKEEEDSALENDEDQDEEDLGSIRTVKRRSRVIQDEDEDDDGDDLSSKSSDNEAALDQAFDGAEESGDELAFTGPSAASRSSAQSVRQKKRNAGAVDVTPTKRRKVALRDQTPAKRR
ncbi:unnamed protein product [Mycena citricolor]|uniref:Uncharacterized protein n=1 Tax=Mycena citricolor TaxID=2018698 RepID=A0AAD2H7R5_9AGAR|nr:unnamed protein product [Mycena citricolor]CAK5284154.1 unnamed protein product [Mycena citricolor]